MTDVEMELVSKGQPQAELSPPAYMSEVECPVKWIYEYVAEIPKYLLDICGSEAKHIKSLLTTDRLSEEEESLFRRVTDLCWKLSLAAQFAFVDDFQSALKSIKMANEELNFHVNLGEDPPIASHVEVYKYVIEASTYAVLKGMLMKNGLSDTMDLTVSSQNFRERWSNLMKDKRSKAIALFLKGSLASSMRLSDNFVLEKWIKASETEPDFHGYYRYIYRKLRQVRRNGMSRGVLPPTDDERNACLKAYSLRPDLGDSMADMANMIAETLNANRRSMTEEEVEAKLETMISLMKKSLSLVSDPWVKVRLAEIYGFGKYNLDAHKGEELFKECIKEWPISTHVWHKAGKFYHLGGNPRGRGPLVDHDKAKEYYSRSLSIRGSNFACLMDYLKLLRDPFDAVDAMIEAIDKYLAFMKKESEYKKLLITKGILLWVHNINEKKRSKACEAWIEVVQKFPSSAREVANSIKRRHHEVVGALDVNTDEVSAVLRKISNGISTAIDGSGEAIEELMKELKRNPMKAGQGTTKSSNRNIPVPRGEVDDCQTMMKELALNTEINESKKLVAVTSGPCSSSSAGIGEQCVKTLKSPRGRGRQIVRC